MAERPHYFGSWCVLFTDAVCLAGAYCLVGTAGSDTMVALSLPIWIVWMSVCYGLLALFLRRPRTTGQLAIVACLLYAAGAALVLSNSVLSGVSSLLFGLVFLLVTPLRTIFLLIEPYKPRTPMNYVELSVSAALVFQLIQLGGIALPGFYNLCILVAVVLCFLYLIGTRLFPNGISSVLFSRGHAAAALAACVFLIAIFFLVTHFAYGPAQQGILHAWEALKATAGTVASALSSGIMYLLSLLPEVEVEGGALPPPQSSSSDAEIMEQASAMLPAWLMPAAILGMIVLLLLIVTLVLRGTRHGGAVKRSSGTTQRIKKSHPALFGRLGVWFRRLSAHLRFRVLSWRYRHTPQGILLGLERWAKSTGFARTSGQTARAFLNQLSQHPAFEADRALLLELADALDHCYFETPAQMPHPAPKQLNTLLHRSAKAGEKS